MVVPVAVPSAIEFALLGFLSDTATSHSAWCNIAVLLSTKSVLHSLRGCSHVCCSHVVLILCGSHVCCTLKLLTASVCVLCKRCIDKEV